MRKTLLDMADGKFAYEQDELVISERRLEFICTPEEIIEGRFVIESGSGAEIRGVLYTTNYRMECNQVQFAGKKVEIGYLFNASGLSDKTTIKGDIYIESNIGEYNLPFVVTVLNESVSSSLGVVRNLFHFTNLAHTDYEQAYRLFLSKKFNNINMESSERVYYQMLVRNNPSREHMEEFLIAVNKKKPVSIQLEENSIEEKYTGEDFSKVVTVKKSGWGYLKIEVSADSDFVQLEKTKIMMDDFVGNQMEYALVIDGGRLHYGNNYARVKFKTAMQEEILEITVNRHQERVIENHLEIKEIKAKLCQLYIQVRTHSIHNLSWIRESMNLLESLMSLVPENKFLILFHAHLLILDKKKDDAAFILDKLMKDRFIKRQEPEVYAYLLYVQALNWQQGDVTSRAVSEIRSLLDIHPHSSKIFWAFMFLDDELQKNPVKKYQMLNEQFVYGCHSPFLYLETFLLLKSDVALMTSIHAFEKQVLSFALHQGLITEELAVHAAKISLSCKGYNVLLVRLLKNFYNLFEKKEIAEGICSQLIKGGFRNKENFYWYELGVKYELKLNLLYEYYLYTIPEDKKGALPKHLLLYFSYNNNVDYRHKAFLYANVTKYKEDVPGLYEKYEPYISQFVEEQLQKRRVSEHLMYLYELHFDYLIEKEECCNILEEIIFTSVIECSKEKMRRVIIGYKELTGCDEFAFMNQKAYVRIYTDSAFVAVEDMTGRLHFETVDFNIKPLLTRSKITKYANLLRQKSTGILLNRYKKSGVVLEKSGISICNKLLQKKEITEKFREELIGRLIGLFEETYDETTVVNLLCKFNFDIIEPVRRAEYFEKMIIYGMYDEVYELIFKYGFEHIRTKRLVRLCSRKISSGCDEDRLVKLCIYVFLSGKYDEVMLNYLASEYYGTTYEMIKLWTAAKNFELDSFKICERLLVQMLYTGFMPGKTMDIFMDYCANGAKKEVIQAYIAYLSYNYVVNKQVVEDSLFDYILEMYNKKEQICDSARLAYIKFSSKKDNINDDEKKFVYESIKYFERQDIIFDFFKKAGRMVGLRSDLYEKTIIEYLTNPKYKVTLYYRILDGKSDNVDFTREELSPMLGPVFAKEITMFYGEVLQYYIVERNTEGEDNLSCSGIIQKEPDDGEIEVGMYGWINEMYLSLSMKDETFLYDLMNKYFKYKIVTEKLFELKE